MNLVGTDAVSPLLAGILVCALIMLGVELVHAVSDAVARRRQ